MHDVSAWKRRLAIVAATALTLTVGANAALAGEVTGNGKSLKTNDGGLNGKSICAYSGLNDSYSGDPTVPDAQGFFRTQNWGQLPLAVRAFLASIGDHPGDACKPGDH
jgi:hypothetical protein